MRYNIYCIILLSFALCISGIAQTSNTPGSNNTVPSIFSNFSVQQPLTYSGPLNYIKVSEPLRSYSNPADLLINSVSSNDISKTTKYLDGLGRPIQIVSWQSSPTKKDIVAPIDYDDYGREPYKFMPYSSIENTGLYKIDPFNAQYSFYTGQYLQQQPAYKNEQIFYSKTNFEASPLGRPLQSFAPGNSWAGSEGSSDEHSTSIEYLYNDKINDAIKIWKVSGGSQLQVVVSDNGNGTQNVYYSWDYNSTQASLAHFLYRTKGAANWITATTNSPTPTTVTIPSGNYEYLVQIVYSTGQIYYLYTYYVFPNQFSVTGDFEDGSLYKTITKDENAKAVVEYKDKEGKVMLKKVQIGDNIPLDFSGQDGKWLCTYYVYDDYNRLRLVIPPKAVAWLRLHNWDFNSTAGTQVMQELCFQYEYDSKDHMTAKKVPGAAWVYMMYDQRDRLVFTQDGNLRSPSFGGSVGEVWAVTLYDELNRPIQTGLMSYAKTRSDLQAYLDGVTDANTPITTNGTTTNKVLKILTIPTRETGRPKYEATESVEFEAGFESEENADFTGEIVLPSVTAFSNLQTVNSYPIPAGFTFVPLTITHYDNYSYTTKRFITSYNSKLTNGGNLYADPLPTAHYDAVKGMVTGTKIRVLTTTTDLTVVAAAPWLESRPYYDEKGRVVQLQSGNYKGGDDVTTTQFDFTGKPVSNYSIHNNNSGNITELATLTEMKYDHAARLTHIWKTINNESTKRRLITHNEYDELGQLKHKDIGQQTTGVTNNGITVYYPVGNSKMEGQDYAYNIRGWLKGVNWNYTPANGPTLPNTDYQNDRWFGMDLSYDWGFQQNQYNGNIGGMRWQSEGDKEQRAYGFGYDAANRLLFADFNQYTSNNWDKSAGIDFTTKMGTGLNDGSAYDENGNIKRMQQNGLKLNSSPLIDDLVYNYYANSNSNKLSSVTDNSLTLDNKLGDFTDKNKTGNDYGYDINGNMITDKNKDIIGNTGIDQITGGAIVYNHLNLPYQITVAGKGTIKYIYDATGNKLEKITDEQASATNNQTPKNTVTTYLGSYIYENNVLQFFGQEEGRVRKKITTFSGTNTTDYVYDYFLKDHLGNIRMVLMDEHVQNIYAAATLEDGATGVEKKFYDIVDGNIVDKSFALGITNYPNNNVVPNNNPTSNTTANSQKVYKLNGAGGGKTGLGITLRVMAGDVVNIFGTSYYYQNNTNDNSNNNLPVLNLLGALLNAPGNVVSSATHGAVTASQLNTISGNAVGGFLNNGNRIPVTSSIPRAYINYIIFDDHFKYVSGGLSPVGNNGSLKKHHDIDPSLQNILIPKNGYLYVYCSNESPVNVFFDNLQVIHDKGPLTEETHYYPFGLTMAGISSKAANSLENKRKWNKGSELQNNEFSDGSGLELYSTFYRSLDPQLGRFWQIDPKPDYAQGLYSAMNNNPISINDPLGDTSVHVDPKGTVLRNYKDGDNSVFVHAKGVTGKDVDSRYTSKNHAAGGLRIGELGGSIDVSGILKNLLTSNSAIAKGLNMVAWANKVRGDQVWDLKDNTNTIFGVAWKFDEHKKLQTAFTFDKIKFLNAADLGNYHAGFTGTFAGIGYREQWVGAGFAEMLKNREFGKMFNPHTYMGTPWGDNSTDYGWNTFGMTDAANQLGKPTPIQVENSILKRQEGDQIRDSQFPKDF